MMLYDYVRELLEMDIIVERDRTDLFDGTAMEGELVDVYVPSYSFGIKYIKFSEYNEMSLTKRLGAPKFARSYFNDLAAAAKENDIHIFQVYETEWSDKREIVQSRIRNVLGYNETIFARKCIIDELSPTESRVFITKNHIQGHVNAFYKFGLFYNMELVAAMTFSKSKYRTDGMKYELVRYATKLNTTVVGGPSKLLTYFLRLHPECGSMLTFADQRYSGVGKTVYDILGFTFSHNSGANHYYYRPENMIMLSRIKMRKDNLSRVLETFDVGRTAYQNCLDNGLHRIWSTGSAVYKRGEEKIYV